MNIESLFVKPLVRDINGVVKAEQVDGKTQFIELDEYVVTKELDRHFRKFFEAYVPATRGRDPIIAGKMGVWISGFFGSGKSHFLKILSYLLENRTVEYGGISKRPIDFFDDKIRDNMLLGDIRAAVQHQTDVILFNIDSRANTDDGDNAILKVFLKVFNERVGYCADYPHIAHLERELDKRRVFADFQARFAEITGSVWLKERDAYDFFRDEMITALAGATGQSVESSRQWMDQLEQNFPLDIKNFCTWVNEYISANQDRNVLFLVDEVGQFIGKNSQMMLKLQTITENLGTHCQGRAWVIVTSQADIDAAIGQLTKQAGDDFSKIQGRFFTRLQLSSTNTNEVIQQRLLEKNDSAKEALAVLYSRNADVLRHQLAFDKTTTVKLESYTDAVAFTDNYPFVPYHYPLVQKVFESIRTKGATGKHLAMGERSLLDAFQSAAKQIKDEEIGVLIPFYCFYAPIESFLEPAVKRTIDQACEKSTLSEFDGKILKTLFLIRYVETIKSTLDNLVTLSIERIDSDRVALKKQIEESLLRLERELLIARNGDEFVFLTNEEKEIENEIRHTDVESAELTHELSNIIFNTVLDGSNSYRYPVNKQDFKFSRFCNGHPRDGMVLEELVVKVISPLDPDYDKFDTRRCLDHSSEGVGSVLIKLSENKRLWEELETYVKTHRFLRLNSGQRPEQEHLLRDKSLENAERHKRLRTDLANQFLDADIYALGEQLVVNNSVPQSRLNEALLYVVNNTFAKMKLLKPCPRDVLDELRAVVMADDAAQLGLDLALPECNPDATKEVELYLLLKSQRNETLYLKELLEHFRKRPFGWHTNEVLLLVARLVLVGRASLVYQATPLELKRSYDALTSVRKQAEVKVAKVRQHNEEEIRKVSQLVKTIFQKTFTGSGEKELAELVHSQLESWKQQLSSFQSKAQAGKFPGKDLIEDGLVLTAGCLAAPTPYALLERFIEDGPRLDEFSDTFEDLKAFYDGQFSTWLRLARALNEQFLANMPELEQNEQSRLALQELKTIYSHAAPYPLLRKVDDLISRVSQVNDALLTERRALALAQIDRRIAMVKRQLDDAQCPDALRNRALQPLQNARRTAESTQVIAHLLTQQTAAEHAVEDAQALINAHIDQVKQARTAQDTKYPLPGTVTPVPQPAGLPAQDGDRHPPATKATVTPVAKRTITISPADIHSRSGQDYLDDATAVDQYLQALRAALMAAIDAGDRVRIK